MQSQIELKGEKTMNQMDHDKVRNDIVLAETVFGQQNVYWEKDYKWIMINGLKLPDIYNKKTTNCLIIIPSGYGYGITGLGEFYLDSSLRVRHNGQWAGFVKYFMPDSRNLYDQGWARLCIHPQWSEDSNILTFLKQVDLLLKNPFSESLI